jgi:hypothetical protein
MIYSKKAIRVSFPFQLGQQGGNMNSISKYLVSLLVLTTTFGAVSSLGQQSKRLRVQVEKAKSGTTVPISKEGLPLKRVVLYSNGVGYFDDKAVSPEIRRSPCNLHQTKSMMS